MLTLYKHVIVIWSDEDRSEMSLEDLGRQADQGDCICSKATVTQILDPEADVDFTDGVGSFFEVGLSHVLESEEA